MPFEQMENHPVLSQSQDFADLCSPLKIINITTFSHAHITPEGDFSLLSNNPKFLENYIRKKYYNADAHANNNHVEAMKYIMWDLVNCKGSTKSMVRDAADLDFKHVFSITEHSSKGKDFYHFGTNLSNPSIYQDYVNHLDLLKSFITYYNDKINKSKIIASAHDFKFKIISNVHMPTMTDKKLQFINAISCKEMKLSLRQVECAHLLIDGATAKEIANKLNISARTVESYIDVMKDKFHSRNKAGLIRALLQYLNNN